MESFKRFDKTEHKPLTSEEARRRYNYSDRPPIQSTLTTDTDVVNYHTTFKRLIDERGSFRELVRKVLDCKNDEEAATKYTADVVAVLVPELPNQDLMSIIKMASILIDNDEYRLIIRKLILSKYIECRRR